MRQRTSAPPSRSSPTDRQRQPASVRARSSSVTPSGTAEIIAWQASRYRRRRRQVYCAALQSETYRLHAASRLRRLAASLDMIDGSRPAATAAVSSARRFMNTLSGVISEGLIPTSNRLRMAVTYLEAAGGPGVATQTATWLEYPCNNNTQQRHPNPGQTSL